MHQKTFVQKIIEKIEKEITFTKEYRQYASLVREIEEIDEEIERIKSDETVEYPEYTFRVCKNKQDPNKYILIVKQPSMLKGMIVFPDERYQPLLQKLDNIEIKIKGRVEIRHSKKGSQFGILVFSPDLEIQLLDTRKFELTQKTSELEDKVRDVKAKLSLKVLGLDFLVTSIERYFNNLEEIATLYDNPKVLEILKNVELLGLEFYYSPLNKIEKALTVYVVDKGAEMTIHYYTGNLTSFVVYRTFNSENEFLLSVKSAYSYILFSTKYIIKPAPEENEKYDIIISYYDSLGGIYHVYGLTKSTLPPNDTIEVNKKLLLERYRKVRELDL